MKQESPTAARWGKPYATQISRLRVQASNVAVGLLGQAIRAVQTAQGVGFPEYIPPDADAARILLAADASEQLQLTWTITVSEAVPRRGDRRIVTVSRRRSAREPLRIQIHFLPTTPLALLAAVHGITLLEIEPR